MTALATYNQVQPEAIKIDSSEHEQLALQAGQLLAVYNIMSDQGLNPNIAITHAEAAPPAKPPRGMGPCIDPLAEGHYNRPYVTLFGSRLIFTGHLPIVEALHETITTQTDLNLAPNATAGNCIASTKEIESIVCRQPMPKEKLSFVGRDHRIIRSGFFGRTQTEKRAELKYHPAERDKDDKLVRKPEIIRSYTELYTGHKVVLVFGILHLAGLPEA